MPAASRLPIAALLLLALILVPFFLWEEAILGWARDFTSQSTGGSAAAMAAGLAALLAADIVLPVPSSLVSTAAGALLGFLPGALTSWAGMTAGSFVGYWLGRRSGGWLAPADRARLDAASRRFGDWIVILFRAVPVLAEASAVFAGASHMRAGRFAWLVALANLGISMVYAAAGAYAASRESFLAAFAGAVALPGLAVIVLKRLGR